MTKHASNANTTVFREAKTGTLIRHPIPNPYPIPNTDLSIFFDPPELPIPRTDAVCCITYARQQILLHTEKFGDGPIPAGLRYRWGFVRLDILPSKVPGHRRLTYDETIGMIGAYSVKMTREGFFGRSASISVTEGGEVLAFVRLGAAVGNEVDVVPRQLHPIPNPYSVPNTALSLDFHDQHGQGPPLAYRDVIACIVAIRREVIKHIQQHGNGPIPFLSYVFGDLGFAIAPTPGHAGPHISYQDTDALLSVYALKMAREGYRGRYAEIFVTQTGETIGDALLSQETPGL